VKLGKDRGDFMDHVVKHEYPKGMTLEELTSTSTSLVLAGSETTATLLSGATYYLLRNPTCLKRLVAEIRDTFTKGEEIDIVNVSQLKYLTAVLEESMRIYPPVPRSVQRVVPPGGDTVLGKWVPGGTVVGVQQYASYHAASNFHAPEKFCPERFLADEADPSFAHDNRRVLQPFSLGPRNCIGRNLAYVEMRLILAKVLWHFDLELADEGDDWADQKAPVLWEKKPLMVRLKTVGR